MPSAGDPRHRELRQTVFILLVLLAGVLALLSWIPFRWTVDRELHDTQYLGQVYTDLPFQEVLLVLPDQGRWMAYAAPAESAEEARDLVQAHIPVTREAQK